MYLNLPSAGISVVTVVIVLYVNYYFN